MCRHPEWGIHGFGEISLFNDDHWSNSLYIRKSDRQKQSREREREGERENEINGLRELETECRWEMRMAWVEKMTVGEKPENVW